MDSRAAKPEKFSYEAEDGLLFRTRDSGDLARCVARLMDEPDTLERMRKKAAEIFRRRFTGEIFARNVEAVYRAARKGAGNGSKTE